MDIDQLLFIKFHKLYNVIPKHGGSQGRILKILSHHSGMTQHELREIMDIQPGSLSEILQKLEKAGYITRTPDINDRRCQILHITEEGRKEFEVSMTQHINDSREFFSVLSEEEKEQLIGIFDKIAESRGISESHKHGQNPLKAD